MTNETLNKLRNGMGPGQVAPGSAFAELTAGRSTDKVHQYPLFLSASHTKQDKHGSEQARECIQFTAIRQPGVTFGKEFEEAVRQRSQDRQNAFGGYQGKTNKDGSIANMGVWAVDAIGKPTQAAQQLLNASASQSAANRGERTSGVQSDGTIKDKDGNDFTTIGDAFSAAGQQLQQKSQRLEDCFLYMPASVVYNEGAAWQKEELGFTGNAVGNMLKNQKSIGDVLKEFGSGLAIPASRAAAVGLSTWVAGKIGGLLTVLGAGGIDKAVLKTTRLAQNPYEEQLFSGIDFRSFNFNFEFVAVSEKEYQAVMDIIKMFRSHSRPTFAIEGGNQALYSYPNEFAITFLHLDVGEGSSNSGQYRENPNLPKLHNCVLTNITTDYAPDGWQAHNKGEPNAITMQLQFTETVKNTREFIDNERSQGGGY